MEPNEHGDYPGEPTPDGQELPEDFFDCANCDHEQEYHLLSGRCTHFRCQCPGFVSRYTD